MNDKFNSILGRLQDVKGSGSQYTAKCPAHDDQTASLSVAYRDGKILLNCFAGCSFDAITHALNLPASAFFEDTGEKKQRLRTSTVAYNYNAADGSLVYRKLRREYNDGTKDFIFIKPDGAYGAPKTRVPYNLPAVIAADTVYFCECEKCADAVIQAGFTATSLDAGANSKWREEYADYFEGKNVIILPDNDDAGITYASRIKSAVPHAVIKKLPDLPKGGDVYDWLAQGRTMQEIGELPEFEYAGRKPGRPKKEKPAKKYTPSEQELLDECVRKYGVYDEEKLTIAGVAFYLAKNGISVKYNETTQDVEFTGIDEDNQRYIVESLPVRVYNELNLHYKKCSMNIVQDYIKYITLKNAYNPVLELIKGSTWDGADRLGELYRIMHIADGDTLSKTLIYKWLWQNLSMLRNYKGEYGADGLLVLKGGQGAGKTTFARKMAMREQFFGESIILDVRNKDSIITAVSCWIGELGEIESTFKSDINALKGFISRGTDRFRVPYGRTDEKHPRRTSFIGTCNSDEYLIDETGNRRYWTIPIEGRMDLDALADFDVLQLYLQVDEQAKNNIQGFRLTHDELAQLTERNSRHEKPIKAEAEIQDILFKAEHDELVYEYMTITEFKELYPALKNYAVTQISSALKKIGAIEVEKKKKDGKVQRLAKLPRPKGAYRLSSLDF